MNRDEIKTTISNILDTINMSKRHGLVIVEVIMPSFPHLDIPLNTPEQGIEVARRINEETGLATFARLATASSVKYAKFPRKKED